MKKLKIILPIFLISLFVFIGNVKASENTIYGSFPNVPSDAKNYIISYDTYWKVFNIQYCKNDNEVIMSTNPVPIPNLDNREYIISIGYCYNKQTKQRNGYTYRRNLGVESMTNAEVLGSEYIDLSERTWNAEQSGNNGIRIFKYGYSPIDRNRLLIKTDYPSYYTGDTIYTYYTNENIYNYETNGTTLTDDMIVLNKELFIQSNEPTIQPPYNIYKNGYTETTFLISNYTIESNQNGYFIRIINNNNGNIQNVNPDATNPDQEITLTSYENTNYTIQIHDMEYNIIEEYSINANVIYENNTNFSIDITNIDNSTREVFYKYIISDTSQNYTCYHSINNNPFIEDLDCTDTSTIYYNLTMPNNGNLAFKIEDANNNIVYEYNQNIVFNVSETYISFQDNFDNNYLNLNVLINRYQTNDIVEYSINNSSFIQTTLTDYSITQNIKNFYINNLNNNDILVVRVKRNNEIISYATYKANYLKYYNNSEEDYNINNIFKKINIENINNELKEYIKNFGNLIINSKIGNLLLLQTFCLVIILIIKMIRN